MEIVDYVAEDVVRHHNLLAEWLGHGTDEALEKLHAEHTADFTLVTIDGEVLDRDTLMAALSGARGTQPGLRIEISDVTVVAQLDDATLVRFRETHRVQDRVTARQVSALLRDYDRMRWAYVHETTLSQ